MNGPPDELSYSTLGLPGFVERSVRWDGQSVHYAVTGLGVGEAREFTPPAEEWDTLWGVLERLRAWEWGEEHIDLGVLDGVQWSFVVSRGGKRIKCHGANAFPPGFRVLQGVIDRLVEGQLSGHGFSEHPHSLLQAAETAGQIGDSPETAAAALARTLKDAAWDEACLNEAAAGLARLKRHAAPAIPALIAALGEPYGSFLAYSGRDALSAIAGDLGLADSAERTRLVAPALPAILTALHEKKLKAEVRRSLVDIVRHAGPHHPDTTTAILTALRDEDRGVFDSARLALEAMNPRPPEAIPVLLEALRERLVAKFGFSESIVRALRLYGEEAADRALPILLEAYDHPEAAVRNRALEGLSELGPAAKAALPKLIAGLSSADRDTHWRCAETLGKIGPAAADAMPALLEALRVCGDHVVRGRAATALGNIGRAEAIPALVAALVDPSEEVAKKAAYTLEAFGPAGAAAVEDLARVLRTGKGPGHWGAAYVLGKLGPVAEPAVPALLAALAADGNQWDRLECATALGRIGPAAASAAPALVAALRDASVQVRIGAARALRLLSYDPATAVAVLAEIVHGKHDHWDRVSACNALAEFGASAGDAIPALSAVLNDPAPRVREAVAKAFGAIALASLDANSAPLAPKPLTRQQRNEPIPPPRSEKPPQREGSTPRKKPWWKFW